MNRLIEKEELKKIQLEILEEVADFCEDQGLNYFLGYGTLIGAIRHHGYIPWDDDVDIVMPRPDYDRFISTFNKTHDVRQVIENSLDRKYTLPFAKVHDTRTYMHETMYKDSGEFGVYIDVFPLDGYGDARQLASIKKMSKWLNAKKAVIDGQRTLKKNLIIALGKVCLIGKSASDIVREMDKVARRYDYQSSVRVKSLFSVYGDNEACDKELLKETIFVEFEGAKYRVPRNYDTYLRKIYGDYMKLPPKEAQVTHHTFKVWWKSTAIDDSNEKE